MAKSFFFAIFSICCLIAQTLSGRLDAQNKQLELSESPSLTDSPFLSCVLLEKVSACKETCSLIGSIYGYPIASGICGEYSECLCNILPNASLEDYWNKKFDSESKNVLEEIRKDGALLKKVLAVLKTPFQTYQETISALKPLLNEEQLKNLLPKDKEAQNIFVADDKFKAVEEYVEKNVQSKQFADGDDTKKYLSSEIGRADGAYFNRMYQEVCRSQNELLIGVLNERSKRLNSGSGACSYKEDEGNVIRLIDVAAVNKLIKISSSKPSNRSDPSTKEKKSKSTARSSNAKDVWWKLQGIKKSEIEELKQGKKEWKVDGQYHVYLKKTSSGLSLEWYNKKHGVDIAMNHIYNGEITQQWDFQNANIELNKNVDGTRTQKWVFKNFTYEVTLDLAGKILHSQTEGKENSSLFKNYKQRINTWCAENDYIVGKDNCIIY